MEYSKLNHLTKINRIITIVIVLVFIKKVIAVNVILSSLTLLLVTTPPILQATEQQLQIKEDFSSYPLNENIWTVYMNAGVIDAENSWINLSSFGNSYPYIHLKGDFDSKNKTCSLEIKFKYKVLTPWGVGISIGNSLIPNKLPLINYDPLGENGNSIRIWSESTNDLRIVYRNCNNKPCLKEKVFSSPPNTNTHIVKVKFKSNFAHVFLDDIDIGSFELSNNFKVWFGNPLVTQTNLTWSQLSIDYVYYSCEHIPLIIIPGLGASWNTEAMVYGREVPNQDWQMTPFVNLYQRLIKTAQINGYQLNQNLFVWNYDWRKPLSEIVSNLGDFIDNTPELATAEKINLVGHSLGGLVARAWTQVDPDHLARVNRLITVGSPHQGVVQAYQALAGGQIGSRPSLGWLAMQLLIQIHRQGFETDAAVIRNLAPILQDLTPTFDFLKKYRRITPVNQSAFFNQHLTVLNQSFNPNQQSYFLAGYTNNHSTPEWLWLRNRNILDRLLDLWPDGRPYKTINGAGDGTVLVKSARWQNVDYSKLRLNHHQIISDPTAVSKIMELLDYPEASIAQTEPPYPNNKLLIFYLASPAQLSVDNLTPANNNLQFIVIPNPENKTYQAKLTGIEKGTYHLYLGQITPKGSFWQTYQGEIQPDEEKVYQLQINLNSPLPDPLIDPTGLNHLTQAYQLLEKLSQETSNSYLSTSLFYLNQAISLAESQRWPQTIAQIKKSLDYLARFARKTNDSQIKQANQTVAIMKIIASGWENILRHQHLASRSKAYRQYRRARGYYSLARRLIRLAQRRHQETPKIKAVFINQSEEFLQTTREGWQKRNYSLVESQGYLVKLLSWMAFVTGR